jgi:hypothetical protein
MKKIAAILSLAALAPVAWTQTTTAVQSPTKPETKATIPAHGTSIATAGTKSTALTSDVLLQRYGQAGGEEAKALLTQYHDQEEALFQQRQAAYEKLQGKTDDERREIWAAMIAAQKSAMTEHHALAARLAAARKAEGEKAAAAEATAQPINPSGTGTR